MIVEQLITTALAGITGCTFHPCQLPESATVPAAFGVYSKVGGESFSDLEGDIDLSRARMQISVYATSYGEVKRLEQAVKDAMRAAVDVLPNKAVSVPVDGYEAETKRFYVHSDFYCWSRE